MGFVPDNPDDKPQSGFVPDSPSPGGFTPDVGSGAKGYLSDPEADQKAYEEAKKRFEVMKPGLGSRFQDAATLNIGRPMQGLASALRGDGYEYGKAVDKYFDEMRDAQNPGMLGTATDIAGSIATPVPIKGGGVRAAIGESAAAAAIEDRAKSVETDERGLMDDATSAVIGGTIGGAMQGLGGAIMPKRPAQVVSEKDLKNAEFDEVLGAARKDLGASGSREGAGNKFQETLRREQGELYESGADAMRRATESGTEFTNRPGARLQYFTRMDYGKNRAADGGQAIPISPEGTPAAHAFQQSIDEFATKSPDKLTLADIDKLRVKARGLRSNAANKTDRSALDDLEQSLDNFVAQSVSTGQLAGDPADSEAFIKAYQSGRGKVREALSIGDSAKLKKILNDDTLPGTVVADELMNVGTKSGKANAAKSAKTIRQALGEESESLAALRSGLIVDIFSGDDPAKIQKRAMKFINENPEMISELFTEDQSQKLFEIARAIENIEVKGLADLSKNQGTRDIFGELVTSIAGNNKLSRFLAANKGATRGAAAGSLVAGSGGAMTGAAAGLASDLALKMFSYRPVRAAIGGTITAARNPLAQSVSELSPYVSDEVMEMEAIREYLSGGEN